MKTLNRIISLLMVALMLTTSIPYTAFTVGASDYDTESYTLTLEINPADSFTVSNSAAGARSFFSRIEFDGCYGNQLSGVARELYDSLVKNYAKDKITGEYTYTFETPFTFNAKISGGSIVMNDELEEIQLELHYALQAAMDAFLYDHPEVFWLKKISSSYGISASGNSIIGYTGIIGDITIIPAEIYAGASAKLSQYDSAVVATLDAITVTDSRYTTLKNIHDFICENAWYNLVDEQRVHSAEPFFIGDGGVVCEGYAKTFKVLCDRLEIPCVLVSGDASGAHMWNYVQMDDGKWYLVDATWDDQDSQIYDTYFLADANTIGFNKVTISEERTERTDFSGTGIFSFVYPTLSAAAYTVHVHEWESDYTVDIEPTCTENGSKSIHCKSCDETKSETEIPFGHTDKNNDDLCDACQLNLTIKESGQCGENVNYILYADGTLIISGTGEMFDCQYYLSAPFFENKDIEKLIINEGVESICNFAFWRCENMKSISIPSTLKSIGKMAFCECDGLTSVLIPEGVEVIGDQAFDCCTNLKTLTLPSTISRIDEYAFYSCNKLEKVYVESLESWLNINFNGYYSNPMQCADRLYFGGKLVTEITIPHGNTHIGDYTFYGCKTLTKIILNDDLKNIGAYAFYGCEKLEEIVIPEGLKIIGEKAFTSCYGLLKITIPHTVTVIGDSAFACVYGLRDVYIDDLESWLNVDFDGEEANPMAYARKLYIGGELLSEIAIPQGITEIPDYSFFNCSHIKSIIIPTSVTYIGYESLPASSEFKTIFYAGNEEQWSAVSIEDEGYLSKDIYYNHPSGHDFSSEFEIEKEPTCTETGLKYKVCTLDGCSAKISEVITTTVHNYKSVVKEPTCTSKGYTTHTCTICGDEYTDTYVKSNGHKGGTATCNAKAECTVCGNEYGFFNYYNHKSVTTLKAVSSTCTKTGLTEGKKCTDCGMVTLAQKTVAKKPHTYKTTTTKATLSKNGKAVTMCTACGTVSKTTTIYYPKTIKLSTTSYAYNGKSKTPIVTVKDSNGKTLKNGTDYTVAYSKGRKAIGEYAVTVTFKGNYSGTKKLTFSIVPAKAALSKLTAGSKQLTASWKKISGVTGYEVQCSTTAKFTAKTTKTVTVKNAKTAKATIKKLTKGKKYYVKVRAYKTVGKTKLYGAWSAVKNVKVK